MYIYRVGNLSFCSSEDNSLSNSINKLLVSCVFVFVPYSKSLSPKYLPTKSFLNFYFFNLPTGVGLPVIDQLVQLLGDGQLLANLLNIVIQFKIIYLPIVGMYLYFLT